MTHNRAAPCELRVSEIRNVNGTAGMSLGSLIAERCPFKVGAVADNWPARHWTFATLAETFGPQVVRVLTDLPRTGGFLPGGQSRYEKGMTFAEFASVIASQPSSPCYLGYAAARTLLGERSSTDYDFASLTGSTEDDTDTRLWIGSAGTCSGLHSDLRDNLFLQVVGSKVVYLVAPEDTRFVYPFVDNIVNSQVDPECFDPLRFPNFSRVRLYRTVVSDGDLLFIPRGWWHYLRSESASISINHWFDRPVSSAEYLRLLVHLGLRYVLRAIQDLIRYRLLHREYRKDFFFAPPSTGERLADLIRYGDFSRGNDPVRDHDETVRRAATREGLRRE